MFKNFDINKSLKTLKYLLLTSLVLSIIFALVKIIFYLSTIETWQQVESLKGSITTSMITSGAVVLIKIRKYLPRITHFNDVEKKKADLNLNTINVTIRNCIIFFVACWILLGVEIYTLIISTQNGHTPGEYQTLVLFPAIFSICTTPISIIVIGVSWLLAQKIKKQNKNQKISFYY